ncbi:hypothetical protein [Methanobacterium alcaliphilum]|uniref:hypothetical protein n=1 Tax=Methanobacterium alcaliphilum TaxID=392018 RepID=UPI00200AEA56|nr:hypothetical protein [Methanobacterium alcaliphilum]MCK9152271.1 hypothetical protein [Methanobacterium alcaliphilum]
MDDNNFMKLTFFLGLVALIDTIYISINHFVLGSPPYFAYTAGVPTAPIGIIFYLVLSFNAYYLNTQKMWVYNVLLGLLAIAFLFGLSAFYTQTFVLKFFCPFAYLYVIISILMFILIILANINQNNEKKVI